VRLGSTRVIRFCALQLQVFGDSVLDEATTRLVILSFVVAGLMNKQVACELNLCEIKPPPPGRNSRRRPPCASTTQRQIDKPMPMPVGFVVKNGSKMRSSFLGSTHGPESSTAILTASVRAPPTTGATGASRVAPSPRWHC
jgi:hypothetical protein